MELVLDLGRMALANNFLTSAQLADTNFHEPKYALELCVCPKCWMMQISETVDPKDLFSDYLYFTSCSQPMVEHARVSANQFMDEFGLRKPYEKGFEPWVCEIACNDGYMLQWFKQDGVPCFGVEPAKNVAAKCREKGIEVHEEFFTNTYASGTGKYDRRGPTFEVATPFDNRKVELLLANNVIAHCPNIHDFVAGIRTVMQSAGNYGKCVVEFPWALQMMARLEWDTIYHEHVFYLTLTALIPLLKQYDLEVFRVEHLSVHGGALRVYIAKRGIQSVRESVAETLSEESVCSSMHTYRNFEWNAGKLMSDLTRMLDGLRIEDKKVAAYGASAKSTVMHNALNWTPEFICDSTPAKQGRFSPGRHAPIMHPSALIQIQPDYCLLNIWNFVDQVLKQEQEYRMRGGRFIVPLPDVRVI